MCIKFTQHLFSSLKIRFISVPVSFYIIYLTISTHTHTHLRMQRMEVWWKEFQNIVNWMENRFSIFSVVFFFYKE